MTPKLKYPKGTWVRAKESSGGGFTAGRVYELREDFYESADPYATMRFARDEKGSSTNGWGQQFFEPVLLGMWPGAVNKVTITQPQGSTVPYIVGQALGSGLQPQTPEGVRAFGTGATRDLDANKLDFEGFLSPLVLERYAEHMHKARQLPDGSMRASDNWQLGIPVDVYMKSMWRHFMAVWKLHRGLPVTEVVNGQTIVKDLETELCALQFNVSGMLHETLKDKNGSGK